MNTFSLVIPFFKRTEYVLQTLHALSLEASYLEYELIIFIVDSHSVPSIEIDISSHHLPFLSINILNTVNSLSSKRNFGASFCRTPFIAFLDDDCLPTHNYIASILDSINTEGALDTFFSGQVSFPSSLVRNSQYIAFRQNLLDKVVRAINSECNFLHAHAMNCVIPSHHFQRLQYDESFTSYGWEDHEFFYRVHASGFLIYNSSFHVIHLEKSNFSSYLSKMIRYGTAVYDVRKRFPAFFLVVPISKIIHFIPTNISLLSFAFVFFLYPMMVIVRYTLFLLDTIPSFISLAPMFRFATLVAFFIGYINPTKLPKGKFI